MPKFLLSIISIVLLFLIPYASATDEPHSNSVSAHFNCEDSTTGERPELSGTELRHESDYWIIHYTLSGSDATTEERVSELVDTLSLTLDIQLNTLHLALPPSDCGEGGDSRLDVYVMDIKDYAGIAIAENIVGDNEHTELIENYSAYSYLIIENDLSYIHDRELALNILRTTVAHELHHSVQFGYDVNDSFIGFYEAGATWIETLVYPEVTFAVNEAQSVLQEPDKCIGNFQGQTSDSARIYGEWLMMDSFTRDSGIDSYQFIWSFLAKYEGLEGFYRALESLDTNPQELIFRMAVRNLLLDYPQGDFFDETVYVEATINGESLIRPARNGVQQLSVDYMYIANNDIYKLELQNTDHLVLYLVGIDENVSTAQVHNIGISGTVDTSVYDHSYVILLNTDQHYFSDDCVYSDWELRVSSGNPGDVISSTGELWDASNFRLAR